MAKFKSNNLELKTNQKIFMGNSKDISLQFDGDNGLLDGKMKITGHAAVGTADIDYPGFPTYEALLRLKETFESGVTGSGIGLAISVENLANDAFVSTAGLSVVVQNDNSIQHYEMIGATFFANITTDGAVIDTVTGVQGNAAGVANNATITNSIGGDFYTVSSFGVVNSVVTNMMAGQFQLLKWGSGDVSITDGYGLLVKTPGFNPSGTTTNLYGLYIEDQSTVGFTNDHNIFSAGVSSKNKFEGDVTIDGNLTIDTIIPVDSTAGLTVNGDIHCDDLYTSGNTIHVGSGMIKSDGSGSIDLYYGETKTLSTWEDANEEGVALGSNNSMILAVETADGDFHIRNLTNSGDVSIESHDSGGTLRTLFSGAPNGRVSLFYGPTGVRHFETHPSGVVIRSQLSAVFEGPSTTCTIGWNGDNFLLDNNHHGGGFQFFAEDSVGASLQLAEMNPDGSVDLYHTGTKVFETAFDGATVIGNLTVTGELLRLNADDSYLRVVDDGTSFGYIELVVDNTQIQYWDTTGVIINGDIHCDDLYTSGDTIHVGSGMIKSTAENVELYHGETKTFETISGGIKWGDGSNTSNFTYDGVNRLLLTHDTAGGHIHIKGRQVGGSLVNLIAMNPDSSISLYTDGVANLITSGSGIQIRNASGNTMNMLYSGDNFRISNTVHGGKVELEGQNLSGIETSMLVANPDGSTDLYHAGVKVFETDSTGIIVTGDIYAGAFIGDGSQLTNLPAPSSIPASDVEYENITPSTYKTVQDGMDTLGSAGLISGGVITSDGTASVNVTAGTGMLRTLNNEFAPIEFINFDAATSLAIAEDETKNVVVAYNGGSPEVQVIDVGTGNIHEYFILGQVGRAGDELFISNIRQRISNFAIRSLARLNGTRAVERDGNAGLIIGESADNNRYVTMTTGDVWTLLDRETIPSFNSGTGDTFTTIYQDSPSGYVETPGETQWPADYYDNGSGTLQPLNNNRFGVRWFWYIPSSNDMAMVYGTGNHKSLAEAEAEPVPTEVPGIITEYGILIGKIICQKDEDIAAEVSSAFDEVYNFSATSNHANLSNLAAPADDHTQYIHRDGRRSFTDEVAGVYPTVDDSLSTKKYVDDQAPDVIMVYGDSTAVNGDILIVDATGEVTITLIASVNAKITIKTIRDNVAIQGDSGTIDGQSSRVLSTQYESMTMVCDGVNWYII